MRTIAERIERLRQRINERVSDETLATHLTKLSVPGIRVRVVERDYGTAIVRADGIAILFEKGKDEEEDAYAVTVMFDKGAPEDVVSSVRNALMRKYYYRAVKRGGPITRLINASRSDAMREAEMVLRHFNARNEGLEILGRLLSEGVELPKTSGIPSYPWPV